MTVRRGRPPSPTPSYNALHKRIRAAWGPASDYPCVNCGARANEWSYDGLDPDEIQGANSNGLPMVYSLNWPRHYDPRCHSCHRFADSPRYCKPRGHDTLALGRTSMGACAECHRETERKRWRAQTPEQKAAYNVRKRAAYAAKRAASANL